MLKVSLFGAIIFLMSTVSLFASEIHHSELNFKVTIPDGFEEYDRLKAHTDARTRQYVKSITLYAYNKGGHPEKNQYTGIFLAIERSLKAMVGKNASEDLSVGVELFKEQWRNCNVNVFRRAEQYRGHTSRVILTAAVDLKPEPIQFKLSGAGRDEDEMRAILQSLLSSLEGESNCIIKERLMPGLKGIVVLLIIASVFFIVIRNVAKDKKKKTSR